MKLPEIDDFNKLDESQQRACLVDFMMENFRPDDQLSWVNAIADLVRGLRSRHKFRLYPFRSAIGYLAWFSRSNSDPLPSDMESHLTEGDEAHKLLCLYYIGDRLRYDFNFRSMHQLFCEKEWDEDLLRGDAVLGAFRAFAALGQGRPEGLKTWEDVKSSCASSPQADGRVSSILLHAMWFGTKVPNQAQLMLDAADELLGDGHTNHPIHYRRAYALRLLRRFDEAIYSIDLAIHGLKPSEPGFLNVHQDYTRERDLISSARQVEESAQRLLDDANFRIATKLEKAQQLVSDSMIKLVEILGLFIAIATVIISSGSVFKADMPSEEKLKLFSYLLVGLLGFFILLRIVVNSGRSRL